METAAISALGVIGFAVAVTNQLARRLHLPPILIYLIIGVVAGPSVTGLFAPADLHEIFPLALEVLVGLLVFEGAFVIDVQFLRRVGAVVRNLLTVGLVVTFLTGTLLAGLLDVLPWRTAFMFGALVSVTGPTVIGPLVRSVRLNDHVRAVLLGEGVLIDPLGAILAVVVLQFALSGLHAEPFLWVPSRLIGGAAIGLVGVLTVRGVLYLNREPTPTEMTLLLLGVSTGILALSERLLPDSGLTAMATMGVVLAAAHLPHLDVVRSFEDELSRILLAAVYVLAAATLDLSLLRGLWPERRAGRDRADGDRAPALRRALLTRVGPAAERATLRRRDRASRRRGGRARRLRGRGAGRGPAGSGADGARVPHGRPHRCRTVELCRATRAAVGGAIDARTDCRRR